MALIEARDIERAGIQAEKVIDEARKQHATEGVVVVMALGRMLAVRTLGGNGLGSSMGRADHVKFMEIAIKSAQLAEASGRSGRDLRKYLRELGEIDMFRNASSYGDFSGLLDGQSVLMINGLAISLVSPQLDPVTAEQLVGDMAGSNSPEHSDGDIGTLFLRAMVAQMMTGIKAGKGTAGLITVNLGSLEAGDVRLGIVAGQRVGGVSRQNFWLDEVVGAKVRAVRITGVASGIKGVGGRKNISTIEGAIPVQVGGERMVAAVGGLKPSTEDSEVVLSSVGQFGVTLASLWG